MMWNFFVFIYLVLSPVLTAVVKEQHGVCSANEFACTDGACVSIDHVCDGLNHCADGSDELQCYSSPDRLPENPIITRVRRQASKCRRNQWQCRDGTCIGFDGKCDGAVDCPDRSDETHALCRNTQCQSNWFRCTYGACADGTAPCNGVQDCADNSDELLPRCRNETAVVRGKFKCENGELIPSASLCDGVADCTDGSDETVRACAATTCPSYLFQCAYGACVDQGADCNDKVECADGSDEADELCNKIGKVTTTTIKPAPVGNCVLPPYPANGGYVVGGVLNAAPGQTYLTVQLNVTCNPGYGVIEDTSLYCIDGLWSQSLPRCVRFCDLKKHPSVEYKCLISGSIEGIRECGEQEPSGTIVRPECRAPNYYHSGVLKNMRCIDGNWDYLAYCNPECGRITPEGEQLVIGGRVAKRGELPWHAGIYRKTTNPYMQICGGSLVTTTVVISAAHCFWTDLDGALPPSKFAVAVGKLYRPWNNPRDDAQKSDVQELKIPRRFQGAAANFQEDIAIVIVATAFVYKTYVRPVCVDFDILFDRRQLEDGKTGKVAGWGLTAANGNASQVLKVVDLPYVSIEECIAQSPSGFREYITSDKICAGWRNGTALCKGDSGGGLVFPENDRGVERYYLRGIVSTAPNNEDLCNAFTLTSFTQITKHQHFIQEFLYF